MFARIGVDPSTASAEIGLDAIVAPILELEDERPVSAMVLKNKKKLL